LLWDFNICVCDLLPPDPDQGVFMSTHTDISTKTVSNFIISNTLLAEINQD